MARLIETLAYAQEALCELATLLNDAGCLDELTEALLDGRKFQRLVWELGYARNHPTWSELKWSGTYAKAMHYFNQCAATFYGMLRALYVSEHELPALWLLRECAPILRLLRESGDPAMRGRFVEALRGDEALRARYASQGFEVAIDDVLGFFEDPNSEEPDQCKKWAEARWNEYVEGDDLSDSWDRYFDWDEDTQTYRDERVDQDPREPYWWEYAHAKWSTKRASTSYERGQQLAEVPHSSRS